MEHGVVHFREGGVSEAIILAGCGWSVILPSAGPLLSWGVSGFGYPRSMLRQSGHFSALAGNPLARRKEGPLANKLVLPTTLATRRTRMKLRT